MNLTSDQTERRLELEAMHQKYRAAWAIHASFDRKGGSSATSEQLALIEKQCGFAWTNAMISELEVLGFLADEPSPYFAYPSLDKKTVTTFTGDILATIIYISKPFEGGFNGSYRQTFRAKAINSRTYFGTIYGTYLRMRAERVKPTKSKP